MLNETCPTAEFDITPEESGLRIRISSTPRGSWADTFLEPLGADEAEQVTSVELPDGIPPVTDWFVLVNITTANSAPLVIVRRVILNGSEMSIDNMRIDSGLPSTSDLLREVLREFCRHPGDSLRETLRKLSQRHGGRPSRDPFSGAQETRPAIACAPQRAVPQLGGLPPGVAGLLVVWLSSPCCRRDSKRLPTAGNASIRPARLKDPRIVRSLSFPRTRGPYNALVRSGGVCTAGAGPGLQN